MRKIENPPCIMWRCSRQLTDGRFPFKLRTNLQPIWESFPCPHYFSWSRYMKWQPPTPQLSFIPTAGVWHSNPPRIYSPHQPTTTACDCGKRCVMSGWRVNTFRLTLPQNSGEGESEGGGLPGQLLATQPWWMARRSVRSLCGVHISAGS